MRFCRKTCIALVLLLLAAVAYASDPLIPKVAWKRGIGVPLEGAGGKKPKLVNMIDDGYWQGAPVGGFGAGTLSRTYRGDFARWHLKTGVHKYDSVDVNQFSMFQQSGTGHGYAQVLFTGKPRGDALKAWNWNYPVGAGTYYALYPKSWFEYPASDKFPAKVIVEQFSPILPGNYKETSYPVAVYRWHAENPTDAPVTVSVMFSWANMVGWLRDSSLNFDHRMQAGNFDAAREESLVAGSAQGKMKGVVFDRKRAVPVSEDWDGQFTIAAIEQPGVEVTTVSTFDPANDGNGVWQQFAHDGRIQSSSPDWNSSGEMLAGAIAVRFTLAPHENKTVPMVLAWDLPIVQFGGGRKWLRHYTDIFGATGTNAWAIAKAGLQNANAWSAAIDEWQKPVISDESKPEWYRATLFNEMYNIADLAGFWGHPLGAPASTNTFGFLECYDYAYYNTLDVLFYGSMPLVKFWPEIDKQVMRAFADTIQQEDSGRYIWEWKTQHSGQESFRTRKAKGAAPHDLGNPIEDPFKSTNQFSWQNTNGWKDLNSKFVLMVYRDYVLEGSKDTPFLRDTWPAVRAAMQYLRQFDRDGDGMIENDGFPDQTYDEWVVRGESAYSGSLYLAALRASEEIGKALNDPSAKEYRSLFDRAQKSYISKLWNGEYFRYDTSSDYRDNIQAEQLAGQWYATLTGLGDLVPIDMARSALKKVYDFNVMKFADGQMGAANGMAPNGTIVTSNEQVQEVWTGATFAVAALMLSEGLKDEAYRTAWGVYNVVWDKKGYWFRTPEAYEVNGMYRASMYMRPGSIWSMEMMAPHAVTGTAQKTATASAK